MKEKCDCTGSTVGKLNESMKIVALLNVIKHGPI